MKENKFAAIDKIRVGTHPLYFLSALQIRFEKYETLRNEDTYQELINSINRAHDEAEQRGFVLFIKRYDEIHIIELAKLLSEIETILLIEYIQAQKGNYKLISNY